LIQKVSECGVGRRWRMVVDSITAKIKWSFHYHFANYIRHTSLELARCTNTFFSLFMTFNNSPIQTALQLEVFGV